MAESFLQGRLSAIMRGRGQDVESFVSFSRGQDLTVRHGGSNFLDIYAL